MQVRVIADFDFAARGPGRLKAESVGPVWVLGPDGGWEGESAPKGSDFLQALGGVEVPRGKVLAGWIAYEAGQFLEPTVAARRLPLYGEAGVFKASWGKRVARHGGDFQLGQSRWNHSQADFETIVREAKEEIGKGNFYQVNMSMAQSRKFQGEPEDLYEALVDRNPGPYTCFWQTEDHALVSNSPELLLAAHGEVLESKPIAGTLRLSAGQDNPLAGFNRDPKERAEHIMLVDLVRNDLGRVSRPGSVEVTELLGVETYTHVAHLVSTVRGQLAAGQNLFGAFGALFPGGTITGAPKVAAMRHIRRTEPHARGPYTGSFFVFEPPDRLTVNILIRTAWMEPGEEQGAWRLKLWAGAGIVADSNPEREWLECRQKLRQFEALR